MASVKRHTNGQWRARYRDPAGREHARHFGRKVDAERWLDSVKVDLVQGVYVSPARGRVTFGEWAAQWLAESVHLKPKTVEGYESVLRVRVLPRWGLVPIGSIDRSAVKAWVAALSAEGVGASTVKNAVNVTSAVFRSALEAGAVKVNPVHGLRLGRAERHEMHFLSAGEVADLSDAIGDPYAVLVTFAAYTGLRAGELAALRWDRIDMLRGSVDVVESFAEVHGALVLGPTKTYARRSVALPRFLVDLLAPSASTSGLVFTSREGGPLRHSNFYRRDFKPAVIAAGLPEGVRFHDLRHTTVALLVAQGAHPLAIKERLGHSSITVTLDQYGHLLPTLDEALTDGLEDAYQKAVADFSRTIRGQVVTLDASQATL
jgi:integrase